MTTYKSSLDKISILASLLCMVHCIVLPLFFSTLPLWGFEILENRLMEALTLFTTLIAGGWAIWQGYSHHHKARFIPIVFLAGLALMGLAMVPDSEWAEMGLKGFGAILVITAHILNWIKCKACSDCVR